MFEHLPVALALVDASGRLVRANAAGRAAFGDPAAGTPLEELAVDLDVRELPNTELRLACLLRADAARLAALTEAAGSSGSLAHDIKNAGTAVSLSLRAVASALGEDEQEVLTDLHDRLSGIEQRIRTALTGQ